MEMYPKVNEIKNNNLKIQVLDTGDIYKVIYDNCMLNMYPASTLDGSIYNVYLKVGKEFTKLIGVNSPSSFAIINNKIIYKGTFNLVSYLLTISLSDNTWFVDVKLNSSSKELVSIYYGFDVGLANEGINEAYNCQYIDHNVIKRNNSYAILSKQNQGRPLLLETSSLNEIDSYSTDGFQFFKKEFKLLNCPLALLDSHLENKNLQYEFAYLVFKTKDEVISEKTYTFYHHIQDNYFTFPTKEVDLNSIIALHNSLEDVDINEIKFNKIVLKYNYNHTVSSLKMTNEELNDIFKELRNVEYGKNNKIYSFFTKNNEYVVTQDMELESIRPTGMVFISNGFKKITRSPMAFTSYMYGVFASHIVLGNTDFNSFTHESKTPLNVLKSKGLRIFIKLDNDYRLLTLPAAFKMSVSSATWYYKINNDLLTIISAISYDENKIEIEINSKNNIKYDFIVTNYINMGNATPTIKQNDNSLTYYFNQSTMAYQKYPNMHYTYKIVNNKLELHDDSFFFNDYKESNNPLMVQKVDNANNVKLLITASYEFDDNFEYEDINNMIDTYYNNFRNNIDNINVSGNDKFINKINDLTIWYVQNALIHYASPHGLEQFSGAAWGCRDVCQGPFELFLTFAKYDIAKDILLKVYSRQFVSNYDWPQWFMFDEYANIQAEDSHGDVIVWPIKALSLYLKVTHDYAILNEKVPYFDFSLGKPSTKVDTIYNHVINELLTIKNSFVKPFNLSCYGGGDWDDTLQPKDKSQAKHMVSGWTIALTLDALSTFIDDLKDTSFDTSLAKDMYDKMLADFNKYLIKDNVPAGFLNYNNGEIEYMLHPLDNKSHIRYRLLPLTRGMIASLYNKKQVKDYLNIMDEYLMYPDGIRLMSDAIKYKGGKNELFNRAETAANFGREIGLLYVHAHIRYLEAMAKIGENERLYEGLNMICPILIKDSVSNALTRQGNVYFSSSDGDFYNRYEANESFNKLKTKEVNVKAGWRLYSSGPGIYLHQLYSKFFGINVLNGGLYLDPILSKNVNNTKVEFTYNNKHITINYHVLTDKSTISEVKVNDKIFTNSNTDTYRNSGLFVPFTDGDMNVEVYCK